MSAKQERCIECDDPTGGGGRGEYYTDAGDGPYCEACWSIKELPATHPASPVSAKPKPLTKAELDYLKENGDLLKLYAGDAQLRATLDALFRYRERTRGWSAEYDTFSDTIAAEEGIE